MQIMYIITFILVHLIGTDREKRSWDLEKREKMKINLKINVKLDSPSFPSKFLIFVTKRNKKGNSYSKVWRREWGPKSMCYKYSEDLKTGLLQYSNGKYVSSLVSSCWNVIRNCAFCPDGQNPTFCPDFEWSFEIWTRIQMSSA